MSQVSGSGEPRWAPRFFLIWGGQALSLLGSSLVQFALVWWMTRETGSATVLATATLVALLPQIVLGPFIGPLVDRLDRRRIMIVSDSAIALATGVLMLLFALGRAELWHVFAILAVRSLGGAFHGPAMAASTSLLVPEEHLARVGGLNQTLHGVMNIVSPPLGALLVMVLPTHGVLAIDLATAALAVAPLLFVSIPPPPRKAAAPGSAARPTGYLHDLKAGLSYVVKWPGLFGVILLAMLLNFLIAPAGSLMPLLVTGSFGKGALELAWTETLMGAGVISGGLVLSAWGGFRKRIATSLSGIVGIGAGIFLMGFAPASAFPLLLAGCFLTGFAQVFANGPLNAIFQSAVDKDMQGRVFSLLGAGATAMMPLSLLAAGPISDLLGIRTWYLAGGVVCVAVTLVAATVPAIMKIEENGHGKNDAPLPASGAPESQPIAPAPETAPVSR
ncbi:MAG: MFS transporter [Spirochaetia bacterium]|nr:MFS transporter [Spirochaetia bacterium]